MTQLSLGVRVYRTGGAIMTLDEAMRVREGMVVVSPHDSPPLAPRRVTQVWQSARGAFVQFRIHAFGDAWIDSSALELPPRGRVYDWAIGAWVEPPKEATR
jgi:hypothetical protein